MSLTVGELEFIEEQLEIIDWPILKRGLTLYNAKMVTYVHYQRADNILEFKVIGTQKPFYKVIIALNDSFEEDEFEFDHELSFSDTEPTDNYSCTCPYFEEYRECKHVAAALHFVLHNKRGDFKDKIDPNQEANTEITYPIIIPCSKEELPSAYEQIPYFPEVKDVKLHLHQITFFNEGLEYRFNGYGYFDLVKVQFKKGDLTIAGHYKKPYLVKAALNYLKERLSPENGDDIFLLTKTQRKAAVKKKLQEMGVFQQLKSPETALKHVFYEDKILMEAGGELHGLKNLFGYEERLKKTLERTKASNHLYLPEEDKQIEEYGAYNVGFGLAHGYGGQLHEVIPFMAKGSNKNPKGFSSKFSRLEDAEDFRLSTNIQLEEILFEIHRIYKDIHRKDSLLVFDLFKRFLSLTSNYPVYYYHGGVSQDGKVMKRHLIKPLQIFQAKASIALDKDQAIYTAETIISFGGQQLLMSEVAKNIQITQAYAIYDDEYLLLFEHANTLKILSFLQREGFIQIIAPEFDAYFRKILLPMASFINIQDNTGTLSNTESEGSLQKQLYITELTGLVIFRPQVKYAEAAFSNPLEGNAIIDPETKRIFLRDEDFEDEYLDFLRTLHPKWKFAGSQGFFHLTHDAFMEKLWFFKAFEQLKANHVRVFGLENIKIKKYNPFPPVVKLEFGSSQDWFEVEATVVFGNQKVKLKDIKRSIERDQEFIELQDGTIGILPEKWVQKFSKLFRSGEAEKEKLKVPKTLFHMLDEFEETQNFPKIVKEITEKKEKLRLFTEIKKAKIPKKLQAELRDYQHTGLNWLNFLQEYQWGGILADDMGLGKTLQMIAFICKVVESKKNAKVLVVAPTTLLFNWKNELGKFAPHLDYFIQHGTRYESAEELSSHQVILTSYGLVINDLDLLKSIHFDLIIADESQAIKNTQSLRYKAIMKLQGKIKMAMTGTPIENSLAELFAQMNFVNPGFFHSFTSFKDNYLSPLKNGNRQILLELQQKIKPFVLRRTKQEVLTELPDKTEEYLYCVMGDKQRKIYDAYRNEYRDYLLKKFDEEGEENSKMYVLEGLTKLRLACDASQLVAKTEEKNESVKIDMLIEHVLEKTGKHKILVFSQFVKMLTLVQQKLEEHQIGYSYLDGSTAMKDREKVVQEFQTDEDKRVFLISLKAGGTGLNLTAADYVYILDPWWNPAVENQAIDRCYRMGQEKHVIAYRMICKDTVEEKIISLQQAKSKLAKEVIFEGDSFLGALDRDSMLALFE